MAAKKKVEVSGETLQIEIPKNDYRLATFVLVGDTPLIVNKFSEKAKQEMLDKQMKRAKAAKEAKDPEACFKGSLYPIPGKVNCYGVPAGGLKQAAVSACRCVGGVTMTAVNAAFHVLAGPGNLVQIEGKPVMREDIVRVGKFPNKTADIRYRAEFTEWKIRVTVKYDAHMVSAEQLAHLFDKAGFSVGLCEWRTEKKGNFGMFHVEKAA